MKLLVTRSCLTLRHHGLQPARLLCPQNSPGKNTGVDCHFLLHFLSNPGMEPVSLTLQAGSLLSEPPGKPSVSGDEILKLEQEQAWQIKGDWTPVEELSWFQWWWSWWVNGASWVLRNDVGKKYLRISSPGGNCGSHPVCPPAFQLDYTKPYKNSMELIHCNLVALL